MPCVPHPQGEEPWEKGCLIQIKKKKKDMLPEKENKDGIRCIKERMFA